ncbi:sugar phosphate isomerase/epimerase family protein [Paenarthrobacter ureafaciens]|uniref:sugar phosphate isomerase/epimerase family protein n=1 Tax=Paenarthrobacter ureafaciens TaxID=37931 RepID=UPI003CEA4E74
MAKPLVAGLCSVTLRNQPIRAVVDAAARAGLEGIEWGTDVHLTADADALAVASLTCAFGLRALSLGSYYRLGDFGNFDALLVRAALAGAPRIRVWAGRIGSAETTRAQRALVVDDARRISDRASCSGIDIALEYHPDTLTDTTPSTISLLEDIDRANVRTYWQPPIGVPNQEAVDSFRDLGDMVSGVHCFSWWPETERLGLHDRQTLWEEIAASAIEQNLKLDFMLEFVSEDRIENVFRDARTLTGILRAAQG